MHDFIPHLAPVGAPTEAKCGMKSFTALTPGSEYGNVSAIRNRAGVGTAIASINFRDNFPFSKENNMNWDQIAGNWKQFTGKAKEKWGKLTDDELIQVAGKRDQLSGIVQKRYGLAKEKAETELDEFAKTLGHS